MDVYLLAGAMVFLGAFTQGLTGFGLALVSVPLLSLTIEPKMAVPIAAFYGWLVTFPILVNMYRHVRYQVAILMFIGSFPGVLIGSSLLKSLPSWIILFAMGVTLIASSIYSLFFNAKGFSIANQWINRSVSVLAGFFAGVLGGAVGEPGPPVIAFLAFQRWKSDEVKATLSFFFMLQMTITIIRFWQQGMMGDAVQLYLLYILPWFVLGFIVGMSSYDRLKTLSIDYHKLVYTALLFIGVSLMVKGFLH